MAQKILVVDDEVNIVKAISLRLEKAGYEVITAHDGVAALSKAREESPDLIILDIMLPQMDGYKVCRLLKFDQNRKHIPILMLTAKIEEEDKALGKKTGADMYMTKPFDYKKILDAIKTLLNK
jgi:DNA-binding response OmpR family regulator